MITCFVMGCVANYKNFVQFFLTYLLLTMTSAI